MGFRGIFLVLGRLGMNYPPAAAGEINKARARVNINVGQRRRLNIRRLYTRKRTLDMLVNHRRRRKLDRFALLAPVSFWISESQWINAIIWVMTRPYVATCVAGRTRTFQKGSKIDSTVHWHALFFLFCASSVF